MNSLARNFWWRWNRSTRELFEEIDPELWEQLDGNPTAVLQRLSAERMAELAADDAILFRLQRECEAFEAYCGRPPGFFGRVRFRLPPTSAPSLRWRSFSASIQAGWASWRAII